MSRWPRSPFGRGRRPGESPRRCHRACKRRSGRDRAAACAVPGRRTLAGTGRTARRPPVSWRAASRRRSRPAGPSGGAVPARTFVGPDRSQACPFAILRGPSCRDRSKRLTVPPPAAIVVEPVGHRTSGRIGPRMHDDLSTALQRHFGHTAFRAGQEDLVRAVVDGHDVLAVMPTGSGKSLGFQLPALLLPGMTLVVSPLISLMKDQVDELTRRGVRAAALHSMRRRRRAARRCEPRAPRASPSARTSRPSASRRTPFSALLRELHVARFVVDEAHCVSRVGTRLPARLPPPARGGGRVPARGRQRGTAARRGIHRDRHAGSARRHRRAARLASAARRRRRASIARTSSSRVRAVTGDREKQRILPSLVRQPACARVRVDAADRGRSRAHAAGRTHRRGRGYHAGLADAERVARAGCVRVRRAAGRVRHERVRHGHRSARRRCGHARRRARVDRGVLPGDRTRGPRRPPGGRHALWNYADVKTREFLIDRGRDDAPGAAGGEVDPAGDRAPQGARAPEAPAHGRLRRHRGLPAGDDPALLRRPGDRANRAARAATAGAARRSTRTAACSCAKSCPGSRVPASVTVAAGSRRCCVGDLDGLPAPLVSLSTTGLLQRRAAAAGRAVDRRRMRRGAGARRPETSTARSA